MVVNVVLWIWRICQRGPTVSARCETPPIYVGSAGEGCGRRTPQFAHR